MSLREEIKPYLTPDGFVCVEPASGNVRDSDNHSMFIAEYYIMLKMNGEATHGDRLELEGKLRKFFPIRGLLDRFPGRDTGQEGPDNMYAVLAACKVYELHDLAEEMLDYGKRYFGWYNNEKPGSLLKGDDSGINWQSFQWRQMQMIYSNLCAANKVRFYHFPLALYTSLVILHTALRNIKNDDADSWRLSWLLIQTVKNNSFLCKLTSKVWYKKLYKCYPNGMKGVAKNYYQGTHPFKFYWVD